MEATQTASPPSFETVWAALQETDRMMKENAERHDKEMKKFEQEMEKRAKQREQERKEFEREMKESTAEFNKKLGKYINLFGEFTEYTMAPYLCDKFIELGFTFHQANRDVCIKDKTNNISLEIDVLLENGDAAMLVEIKTKLTIERINYHIERLEKMRKYADIRGDSGLKSVRTFLGAVAGVVVTDDVRNYALEQGFYLIEPAGQDLNITPPNGKPKEW
jgi:hypothetical protein